MIQSAAELDALIPMQRDARTVPPGTPAPYSLGDLVAISFHDFIRSEPTWLPGTVLSCERPPGARRFVCRVAIGNSGPSPVTVERAYCWEDGSGESLVPLSEEHPGLDLDRLNNKHRMVPA